MKIEDYEFVDMLAPKVESANSVAVTLGTKNLAWVALFRDDVIALAKHFKLTADDIL